MQTSVSCSSQIATSARSETKRTFSKLSAPSLYRKNDCLYVSQFKTHSTLARQRTQKQRFKHAALTTSASTKDMSAEIADQLNGTNLIVVGDDGAANSAVAMALADALGYNPIVTETIVEQVTQTSIQELVDSEGLAGLGGVEFVVMQDLASYTRMVVSTAGGGGGAAARGDCWTHFFGAITIWLDDGAQGDDAPQREVYQQAEIQLKIQSAAEREGEEWKDSLVKATLSGIETMLEADPQITGKKSLYIRMGCRGDWPDFKPPGWDPNNPDENTEM